MKYLLCAVSLFLIVSRTINTKEAASAYKAGFKTMHAVDKSRMYKPNTDTTDYLHYRPIDVDIWYPASSSATDSALLFRNISGLFDKRANYYTASIAGNGLSQQIAELFCTGFKCSDTAGLLNYRTHSFENVPAIQHKFPLVIYLSAFNGMSYENFSLFEELAAKGFVVVSISSIGRFPGDMTMKKEDLMEQVNDALVSLDILKQECNIDFTKIGIVGYSWGGLAAAVAASKIPDVACLVSLDGSEFHHYGEAKEEDNDFDGIKNSSDFKNMHLAMPYLRLESSPSARNNKKDTVYNFLEKLSANNQVFKIDSAQHEDFGCMSLVVRISGNCKDNNSFNTISKITVAFLEAHLQNTNGFSQIVSNEMNKTIHKK